jgi:hypothetical protein
MDTNTTRQFFVNPAEVINRSRQSVTFDGSVGHASGGGCKSCNCVNCRSCDNSCNK